MRRHHPKNERIKREYFTYLEQAKRMNSASVDQVAAAISQFEASTNYKDFAKFHIEQAVRFKRTLDEATNATTGKPLAKATIYHRLMALKAFFQWLAGQSGYKSRISYSDADYFNPSNRDSRIAKAVHEKRVPTLEQIRHVLAAMPSTTDIERRNRALIAFIILTGARDNAVASVSLRHVDPVARRVFQDARDVRTKAAKTIYSDFFPVGDDIESIVTEWIAFLTTEKLYGPSDPLFPMSCVAVGPSGHFECIGLDRKHWRNAAAIRSIFKRAFTSAGLPYFNPHSFRDCLADLGKRICSTPEEFKAWSQNFGHEDVLTTFRNYGPVTAARQTDILSRLGGTADRPIQEVDPAYVARVIAAMKSQPAV